VKPAAEISENKRIGILATERTVNGLYLEELIHDFASNCYVEKIAGSGIVRFVENDFFTSLPARQTEIIEKAVIQFKKSDVDTVVLGCTHFIYISDLLKTKLGDKINIIDSRDGVGKQILSILKKNNMFSELKTDDYFYRTLDDISESSYRKFAQMFGLIYEGVIGEK
jgi:glutamate racemase